MTHKPTAVRIVAGWHDALNAGDIDRLVALSHAEIEVGGPRGTARGEQTLRDWVDRANIRLEPGRAFHRGDIVVVEQEAQWRDPGTGAVSGAETVASTFVVSKERVASVVRYPGLTDALQAASLDGAHEVTAQ